MTFKMSSLPRLSGLSVVGTAPDLMASWCNFRPFSSVDFFYFTSELLLVCGTFIYLAGTDILPRSLIGGKLVDSLDPMTYFFLFSMFLNFLFCVLTAPLFQPGN